MTIQDMPPQEFLTMAMGWFGATSLLIMALYIAAEFFLFARNLWHRFLRH